MFDAYICLPADNAEDGARLVAALEAAGRSAWSGHEPLTPVEAGASVLVLAWTPERTLDDNCLDIALTALQARALVSLVEGTVVPPAVMRHLPILKTPRDADADELFVQTVTAQLEAEAPPPAPVTPPDRYCLLDRLGEGASKVVFLAFDRQLKREVALAWIRVAAPGAVAAALGEARTMAQVSHHPSIVTIFDVIETGDDAVLLVTDYLAHGNLSDWQQRQRGRAGYFQAVGDLLGQVMEGLEHAHRRGIVHLDIKPENVLLDGYGRAHLNDFGVAELAGTEPQRLVGTPEYCPPEMIRGEPADVRCDLYALGCVLYELLTGKPPFSSEVVQNIINGHLSTPPTPPREIEPEVPPALDHLCMRLLAKEPAARPGSVAEARLALSTFSRAAPPVTEQPAPAGRHPLLAPVIAAALAGALIVAIAVLGAA